MTNVIIAHYNDYDNLYKALASLLAQTKSMFIVTIVDDKSPDQDKLDAVIEQYNNSKLKINLIRNEVNMGPGPARQVGIDASNCQYLIFLDSDDMLYPRAVELLSREIQANDADMVYSDIYTEFDNGKLVLKLGENTTWFHGKIYSREYLQRINLRLDNLDFRYNEDSYFNLCANILTKKKYALKEEITYLWRNNKKSLTRINGQQDFIYKHNLEYLYSQVRAVEFMMAKEVPVEGGPIAKTIANIYGAYELEYLLHKDNIAEMDRLLTEMFKIPLFNLHLNDLETINILINDLRQTKQYGLEVFFYQHSYASFYQYFVNEARKGDK